MTLRDTLILLRRARRKLNKTRTYENAVALQRAQRRFEEAKRKAIQLIA